MTVREFANKRLLDQGNKDYETRYWAAYLDGVNAQEKEDCALLQDHFKTKNIDCATGKFTNVSEFIKSFEESQNNHQNTDSLL